jgi:uncharacterized protein (DUF983 family)
MASPSTTTLLRRGAAKRCPVCGQGRLFRRWFTMVEDCPRCGLHFERVEGHWIGALGINTIVSFGTLLVAVVVGVLVTLPDVDVVPVTIAAVAVAVLVPLGYYPFSKTLWTAIDVAMRPVEPDEVFPGFWS